MRILFKYFIIIILFFSCNTSTKPELIYENGKVVGEKYKLDDENIFYRTFYEDSDIVKYEYFEKNGKVEGVFKGFYKNGQTKVVRRYKDHVRISRDTIFYENGSIKQIFNTEKNYTHGESNFYLPNGLLEANHYYYKDTIFHSIIYQYEGDSLTNEKYLFRPLIDIDKVDYSLGDTVHVSFLLPYEGDKFNLNQFQLTYDYFDPEVLSKKEVLSAKKYGFFIDTIIQVKFVVDKSGEWKIFCYLDYIDDTGKIIQYEYNGRTLQVKSK